MAKPTLIYLASVLAVGGLLNLVPLTSSFPPFVHRTSANNGNPFQATSALPRNYRFIWSTPEPPEELRHNLRDVEVYIYSRRGDILLHDRLEVNARTWPELHYYFTVIPATIVICGRDRNNREIYHTSAILPNSDSKAPEQLFYLP